MSKIEPIILENVDYYTAGGIWPHIIKLADIPSSKIEEYKLRPEDYRPWDKSVGPDDTHIVKFGDHFAGGGVYASHSWHDVTVDYKGEKTIRISCFPLSPRSFVEIWQRSNSIQQVIASYKANHSGGYCINDVRVKARSLRKQGVPLKRLPYWHVDAKPEPKKHYLADFATSLLLKEVAM
jgi:hypothetical protein